MTLDDIGYMDILERVGNVHQKKSLVGVLREWDDARTRLNPNAKWYDMRSPEPTTIEIADVISVLSSVAKERQSRNFTGYEEIVETLIEVENRIRRVSRERGFACPMCYDCPKNCPLETNKKGGNE